MPNPLPGPDKQAEETYRDVRDLWRRSGLKRASIERLAAADAFRSLGLDRRQALWEVRGLPKELPLPLFDHAEAAKPAMRRKSASGDAALRACGERLPDLAPIAESPPDELPARPLRRGAHLSCAD